MNQNMILARNFLFKLFIVGFAFLLIPSISLIFMKDSGAEVAFRLYNVEPAYYYNIAFTLLGIIKLVLFFLILAPALALHWEIKANKPD